MFGIGDLCCFVGGVQKYYDQFVVVYLCLYYQVFVCFVDEVCFLQVDILVVVVNQVIGVVESYFVLVDFEVGFFVGGEFMQQGLFVCDFYQCGQIFGVGLVVVGQVSGFDIVCVYYVQGLCFLVYGGNCSVQFVWIVLGQGVSGIVFGSY